MPTKIIEYIPPMKKIETGDDDNDAFFRSIEEMSEKYNPMIYYPEPEVKPIKEERKKILKIPKLAKERKDKGGEERACHKTKENI